MKKFLLKLLRGRTLVVRERIVQGRVSFGLSPLKPEGGWYDPSTGDYGIYGEPKILRVVNIL